MANTPAHLQKQRALVTKTNLAAERNYQTEDRKFVSRWMCSLKKKKIEIESIKQKRA